MSSFEQHVAGRVPKAGKAPDERPEWLEPIPVSTI
jgi:hypothetical protein